MVSDTFLQACYAENVPVVLNQFQGSCLVFTRLTFSLTTVSFQVLPSSVSCATHFTRRIVLTGLITSPNISSTVQVGQLSVARWYRKVSLGWSCDSVWHKGIECFLSSFVRLALALQISLNYKLNKTQFLCLVLIMIIMDISGAPYRTCQNFPTAQGAYKVIQNNSDMTHKGKQEGKMKTFIEGLACCLNSLTEKLPKYTY